MYKKNIIALAFVLLLVSGFFFNLNNTNAQQRTIIAEDEIVAEGQIVPEEKSNKSLYTITIFGLLLVAGGALYLFWVQTQPIEVEGQKPQPKPKRKSAVKTKPKPNPKK